MDRKQLKQKLASLQRMDLQLLLAEMVDEMAECGDQKMAVSFNDHGKPVAGVVLLAGPDIGPHLEALDSVTPDAVPEVTEAMQLAGAQEWDRQHKLGLRNWLQMAEKMYLAMHEARYAEERGHG